MSIFPDINICLESDARGQLIVRIDLPRIGIMGVEVIRSHNSSEGCVAHCVTALGIRRAIKKALNEAYGEMKQKEIASARDEIS